MLQKLKNKYITSAVALIALLAVAFSMFSVLCDNFVLAEDARIWSGNTAEGYAGGTGTKDDPYQIATGEQLYKMVSEHCVPIDPAAGAYYKLTADIYLNDVSDPEWYNGTNLNEWYSINMAYQGQGFNGNLVGDGHTVYGIYYSNNPFKGGLIPIVAGTGSISDVHVRNSYLNGSKSSGHCYLGGIAGYVQSRATFKITRCSVRDTVFGDANAVGGIVGGISSGSVTITSCCFVGSFSGLSTYAGGIYGDSWGSPTVTDCYTVGCVAIDKTNSVAGSVRYSTVAQSSSKSAQSVAVTIVSENEIKGESAKSAMPDLDWNTIWYTVENDYPHLNVIASSNIDGIVGGIWSGKCADNYAGGTGTKEDPYLIATGEQLYKMVSEHCVAIDSAPGAYYKLTADIYLNDVSDPEWYNGTNLKEWYSINLAARDQGFKGNLIGGGHTVYGIYYENNSYKGGLIPIVAGAGSIIDVHIRDSYLNGSKSSGFCYLGGIAGYVQSGAAFKIRGCSVRDTVFGDANAVGGIVGGVSGGSVTITSCYFVGSFSGLATYAGGIYGDSWGTTTVNDCYTAGCVAIDKTAGAGGGARYSTVAQSSSKSAQSVAVTVVSENEIKGESAKSAMPGLDWDTTWYTVENDYPHLNVISNSAVNGIVGAIWSGKCADSYAGGTGTKEDPYQIATGEQLYKMVSEHVIVNDTPAYYVLTADIKLNDTTEENWYEKEGNKSWYHTYGISSAFAGHFDGQGHIVSGMYIKTNEAEVRGALFPGMDVKATIKNVGVTNSYVDVSTTNNGCYGAAIVAYIKNWKENYELVEENYPVISGCFIDTSTTIKATYAGGIVSGTPSAVKIQDCYSVGKLIGGSHTGAFIGNTWNNGCIVENSYAATQDFDKGAGGRADVASSGVEYRNTYIFGTAEGIGINFVLIDDMLGEKAKSSMPALDYENIWQTVDNTTPVLKLFYPRISKGTNDGNRTATLSFVTNVEGMTIEPITAKIGSKLTLPTPTREGYRFEGWYVYSEIQCKFTETTFPYVDTILYANWEVDSIIQNFELYTNSEYDVGEDHEYYRPGVDNYSANNVHGGSKAMHRMGNTSSEDEFLVNYEDELVVGGEYKMIFWIMTDTENATGDLSVAFKNWPDIMESNNGVEKVMSLSTLKTGEWTKCTYSFVAKSSWISFISTGNTSIYFDDIMMIKTSDKLHYVSNNSTDTDNDSLIQTLPEADTSVQPDDKDTTDSNANAQTDNTQKDNTDKATSSDKKDDKDTSSDINYLWVIIPVAAVVVIAGGVFLIILLKRRKKKSI